jgi:two-component system, cell cycle response regulator
VSGTTILVADDSPVYRKLVEQAVAENAGTVCFANTGREAIEIVERLHPSIVITDWVMPDLTGIELCQKIRAEANAAYTYIILLTSNTEKENVVKGLSAGADDYLTKPFHRDELLARVRVGERLIELQRQIEAKNRQLEELALTDSLTGLPNRRAVESWAPRLLSGAARHDFPFWVVAMDLDHFKSINDRFGHEAGDMVLKRFAEILKVNGRKSDICGRTGGEEFLQVVTHAGPSEVRLVIERIRQQLMSQKFTLDGTEVTVTVSFGVAGFCGKKAPEFTELVKQADAALYRAKHLGRNRAEIQPLVEG